MNLKLWTLAAITALSLGAHADEEIMHGTTGWFNQSDVLRQDFGSATYVDKVILKAEGGYANFTMAQVYADGEWVANLGVPGRDPVYPVVIRRQVRSITVRFDGQVHIIDMEIHGPSRQQDDESFDGTASSDDTVEQLADKAMGTVNFLQDSLSDQDFNTYLKPIRKAALMLSAESGGRNSTSDFTREAAVKLITAIKRACDLEDRLIEREKYDRAVRNLETVQAALEHKYDIEVKVVSQ